MTTPIVSGRVSAAAEPVLKFDITGVQQGDLIPLHLDRGNAVKQKIQCDHVYKMDYEIMLKQHVETGADVDGAQAIGLPICVHRRFSSTAAPILL